MYFIKLLKTESQLILSAEIISVNFCTCVSTPNISTSTPCNLFQTGSIIADYLAIILKQTKNCSVVIELKIYTDLIDVTLLPLFLR